MKLWLIILFTFPGCRGFNAFNYDGELDCPSHGDRWLPKKMIPWGIPNRARLTIPNGIRLAESSIPRAGLGIIATTFISRYTWLAEYEGEVVADPSNASPFTWSVWRNQERSHYIDGWDERTSNWLRWINCPRNEKEENVRNMECMGKIHYVTTKDIYPTQELLIYYGNAYASALIVDVDN